MKPIRANDTGGILLLRKFRHHFCVDDLLKCFVRNLRFQSSADRYSNFPLVWCDQNQDTIIVLLITDAPQISQFAGIVGNFLIIQ
jgi:hypothetical protein